MSEKIESRPNINVTPLIDILLVLLIIFMAISPLKPARFEAKVPAESKDQMIDPNPKTLIVTINPDSSLALNGERDLGTIAEPQKLVARLSETFRKRLENHVYADGIELKTNLPENEKILKTVFIKAPRSLAYGEAVKVIDSVKISGANPIGLQIDELQ
ncbi:MAG: biopolymer transporter ExbD [Pyrinomonadaceae bacterium]